MPSPTDHSTLPGSLPQQTEKKPDTGQVKPRDDVEAITPYNFQPYYGTGSFVPDYSPYLNPDPVPKTATPKTPVAAPTNQPASQQTIDVPFKVVPYPESAEDRAYKNYINQQIVQVREQAQQSLNEREAAAKAQVQRHATDSLEDIRYRQIVNQGLEQTRREAQIRLAEREAAFSAQLKQQAATFGKNDPYQQRVNEQIAQTKKDAQQLLDAKQQFNVERIEAEARNRDKAYDTSTQQRRDQVKSDAEASLRERRKVANIDAYNTGNEIYTPDRAEAIKRSELQKQRAREAEFQKQQLQKDFVKAKQRQDAEYSEYMELKRRHQPSNHPATPKAQHQEFTPQPYPRQQPLPYAEPAEFRQQTPFLRPPTGGAIVIATKPGALAPIPKAPNFPFKPLPLPAPRPVSPQMPSPLPPLRPPLPSPLPRLQPPSMRPPNVPGRPGGDNAMNPFFGIPPYASPLLPPGDPGSVLNPNNPIQGFLDKYFPPLPGNKPPLKPSPSVPVNSPPVPFPYPKIKGLATYKITITYEIRSWSIFAGFITRIAEAGSNFGAYELLGCWVEFTPRTDSLYYTENGGVIVRSRETKDAEPKNVKRFSFLSKNPGFGTAQNFGSSFIVEKVLNVKISIVNVQEKKQPSSQLFPYPFPDGIPDPIPYGFPESDPLPKPPKPYPQNKPVPQNQPTPTPQPKPVPAPQPKPVPAPQPKPVPAPQPKPVPTPENEPIPIVFPFPKPTPDPNLDPNPDAKPKPQPIPKIVGFPLPKPVPQNPPKPLPKPDPKPFPKPQPDLYYPPPPPCPVPEFDMDCRYKIVQIDVKVFWFCLFNPITKKKEPVWKPTQVNALMGTETQVKLMYDRLYELEKVQCDESKIEAVSASPEWWQARPGSERPQLLLQFSEQKDDGSFSPPMYQITIPHYYGEKLVNPPISPYNGGNYQASVTLKDNSKIIVNGATLFEAENTLAEAYGMVGNNFQGDNQFKVGKMGGKPIAVKKLVCRIAKYFSSGQRNTKPDWISYFYER